MKKKILSLALISLLFLLVLGACGSNNNEDANANGNKDNNVVENNEKDNENVNENEEDAASDTRIVVDQTGREVELPNEVTRAITTWGPATSLIFNIKGQDLLVGIDNHSQTNEFFLEIYPGIADIPKIGNRRGLNIEEMVAAQPQVVFLWEGEDTAHVADQLDQQGIASFFIIPESAEDLKKATLLMGEVMNLNEEAEAAVAYYEDTVDMIAEKLADIATEDRPLIYFSGSGGLLNTMGQDYYQHYMVESGGGINAAAELKGYGWQDVSPEQLVAWNPDVIIATQMVDEEFVDVINSNPGLNTIEAIKNEELYLFPSNLTSWDFPTPLSVLGILWLADTLYPEEFADFDFEQAVEDYHQEFYGKGFTELGGNLDESSRQSLN